MEKGMPVEEIEKTEAGSYRKEKLENIRQKIRFFLKRRK